MTLRHGEAFSIELTDEAMVADYRTDENQTKLVIVAPESNELFTYTGDFEIMDMIIANSENQIDVNVINTPQEFNLDTAYPNPFNPVTNLKFGLPVDSKVSIQIYNLQGQVVSTLLNDNMQAGYHSVVWNADNHSSGIYFVQMIAGDYIHTQKIMLVK